VHSAQARLSARVMTALPLAMLMLLVATSDSVRRVTVSPFGALVVTVGVALNLIGWRWMRATIERAGR
jgi:Flp pilus assembly protein TadB